MKARKRTSAASGNGRTNGRARSAAARRPAGIVDRTGDYAQAIVKSLSEAILTADDEGRFIDANEGAVALFGVSQEHLTGRGVADFTAEGFDFQPAWKEFRRQGTFRGEVPLRRPDGTVRYVDCSATADFLPGQHLLVLRDLTSRRLAERR